MVPLHLYIAEEESQVVTFKELPTVAGWLLNGKDRSCPLNSWPEPDKTYLITISKYSTLFLALTIIVMDLLPTASTDSKIKKDNANVQIGGRPR